MGAFQALGLLHQLAEEQGPGDPGEALVRGQATGLGKEVRGLDHAQFRGFRVERAPEAFAAPSRGQHDLREPGGPGHAQGLADGGQPGVVAVGPDDPGGAQDGEPAANPQARVHGPLGQLRAVRDLDDHPRARAQAGFLQGLGHGRPDLLPGAGVDGRFARGHGQAGQGHCSDPCSGFEGNFSIPQPALLENKGMNFCPVCHIRVISCVLDHHGPGPQALGLAAGHGHHQPAAAGQGRVHLGRAEAQGQEQRGGLGRGRGGRARGEALAQDAHRGAGPWSTRTPAAWAMFRSMFLKR